MGPPRRVCRAGLLFVLLVALAAGVARTGAARRGRARWIKVARCETQNAGQMSAPGALVPFYVGMASMGVCIIAHVCQICQRLLAAGHA
ncbi:envelope glycoprotein N [Human alphaherpesvirus 1]|nr:envelope glycoprotein N [Human alphaherpesvirus 1]